MANINAYPMRTTERESISSFARVSFGAAGAPTLDRGKDVSGIARDSQGLYTLTLKEKWFELLAFEGKIRCTAVSGLQTQLVAVDLANKTIQFRFANEAAAETDPQNGDDVYIYMQLSNTSLNY